MTRHEAPVLTPEETKAYELGFFKAAEAQGRNQYFAYYCRVYCPWKDIPENEPLIRQFIRGWKDAAL